MNYYTLIICTGHPWICENGVAPDRALDPAVLSRLKQFSAMNKLKKMALRVSVQHTFRIGGRTEVGHLFKCYFQVCMDQISCYWKGLMHARTHPHYCLKQH